MLLKCRRNSAPTGLYPSNHRHRASKKGAVALMHQSLARTSESPVVTVSGLTRRRFPALAALAVVVGFAFGGFSWWEAYPVLNDRYWDGIAAIRPASY